MRFRLTTCFCLLALLTAAPALAQTPGNCQLGTASATLEASDVRALLFNKGNLFYNGGSALGYIVPQASGRSPVFAAGLWVGGTVNGAVRTAAATYAQGGANYEFYPGPLDPGATLPEPNCRRTNANGREAWNRIYVVTPEDIAAPDLVDWPVGLGAPTVDADGNLVVPTSRDQLIDLDAGERPVFYGSETAFWVMNDVGGAHLSTGSAPLGIEVQAIAFTTYAPPVPALHQSTFYRFRVINRNSLPIEDAYLTFWTDPDLGNWNDDYVGTDSTRGMAFAYNADNFDEPGDGGYGTAPPAVGFDLLNGAGGTMYYNNSPDPATGNPGTAEDHYNLMQSRWLDGTPLTEGGGGYDPGGDPIAYVYPGAPETEAFWSEVNTNGTGANNPPGDRRILISAPRVTLQPGAARDIDIAIVFARGSSNLNSVTRLREASTFVQDLYDSGLLFFGGGTVSIEGGAPGAPALALDAPRPNPSAGRVALAFSVAAPGNARLAVLDLLGREVAVVVDGPVTAGRHEIALDAARLPAGVYVVRLEAAGARVTRKVTLLP